MTSYTEAEQRELHRGQFVQRVREAILAYLLILPATLATLVFGVYPVASGLWESLKAGRPITNRYVGLDQYLQGIGSLAYVAILALSLIFCLLAAQAWKRARDAYRENPIDPVWMVWVYLIPGFFTSLGLLSFLTLWVTKGYVYLIEIASIEFSVIWVSIIFLALGLGGYVYLNRQTKGNSGAYIMNTWLVMLLTLLPVLLVRYAYTELKDNTKEAREVASLILTTEVGNARPLRPIDGVAYTGIEMQDEVPVRVQIGDNEFDAVLSNDFYEQVAADKVTDAGIRFANNQRVQVQVPLVRGLGFDTIQFETEGNLVLEPQQIGEAPTLEVPFVIGDSDIVAPYDVFVTGDIGEKVVARSARTTPVERPFLAAVAIGVLLGGIYIIGVYRKAWAMDEARQQINAWLGVTRALLWLVVFALAAYVLAQVHFYREASFGLQSLSIEQFQVAYEYATGTAPPPTLRPEKLAAALLYFPQTIAIATGAMLIGMAFLIWNEAKTRDTTSGMSSNLLFAILLMVGGWLCISELPNTIMAAGSHAVDARDALLRTAMYSLGTVPAQLALGMTLAYLLFYEVNIGKSLFRLVYFMPYITPQVATATVFTVIFSLSNTGLMNQFLDTFGIGPQLWLKESDGIVRVAYEEVFNGRASDIPAFFQGPSLALVTVIMFNIWVYSGYNAVIFLAGLGAIPGELYEAARVDGAGRWSAFRHITFPLLSPVTFFLSILSIIGTFKAFGSVYTIKDPSNDYADTFTIYIFDQLRLDNDRGYAAALAFVLFGVIMVLTFVQTRIARGRVFYG